MLKINELHSVCSVLDKIEIAVSKSLEDTPSDENRLMIDEWIRIQSQGALYSYGLNSHEDAHCLLSLALKYGPQFLVTRYGDCNYSFEGSTDLAS